MACPEYIGQLPDIDGYGLHFGRTGNSIYAMQGVGESLSHNVISKFSFPGLDYVTTRTPVQAGKVMFLNSSFCLSPHATGGSGSADTGDGVNDGDLVYVLSTTGFDAELWWTPGGAGSSYRIGWFVGNLLPQICKRHAHGDLWGMTQALATGFTDDWEIWRMPFPTDAADAAAMEAAQNAAGRTWVPVAANLLATGTHPNTQIRWDDPIATPDGAVWIENGNLSTRHELWRWAPGGGFDVMVALVSNGSGGFIGIPTNETPVSIPRNDSSVWTVIEDSFTPGHTDAIQIAPDGTVTNAPCLDTFSFPPLSATYDNVRLTGVAFHVNKGRLAVNLINSQIGHIWWLDEPPSAPWLRQRQRDDIVRATGVRNAPTSRQRSIRAGVRNTYV